MGTIAEKLTYLNTTKQRLKDSINALGGDLDNTDTFRSYAEELDNIYDKLPKVTGTGSDLSLTPTLKGALGIVPLGNAEQDTYTGKNKFNQANVTQLIKNSASTTSGIINQNGIITITNSYGALGTYSMLYIMNITSGQVTISFKAMLSGTNTGNGIFVNVFDTNHVNACSNYQQLTAQSKDTWYNYTATFTLNSYAQNGINLDIQAWNGGNSIKLQEIQVEVGSSATDYEPYVGGIPAPNPEYPQDIKVVTGDNQVVVSNKNWIDNTNLNYSWANVASLYIQLSSLDTGIRFESTFPSGGPVVAFKLFDLNNYIGKTIRMKSKMTSGGQYRLDLIDENATSVTPIQTASTSEQVISYTVPNNLTDKHYLAFTLIDIVGTSRQIDFTDLILTIENDDLTYIPHQEQSYTLHLGSLELCKIGDYQDVITGTKDNWKVVRPIYKKVFNGTETWNSWFNVNECIGFYCNDNTLVRPSNENTYNHLLLSDKFSEAETRLEIVNGLAEKIKQCGGSGNQYLAIGLDKSKLNDYSTSANAIASFKTWLASNNVTVYEVKATPTEETITDTTLINELNGLQDLLSYDGTTNITITSDSNNAQMIISASALKGE